MSDFFYLETICRKGKNDMDFDEGMYVSVNFDTTKHTGYTKVVMNIDGNY